MPGVITTTPERAVMQALNKLGVEYIFQSKLLGGYGEKGSARADFELPSYGIIISVMGEYWHYGRPDTEARDRMQRIALETSGITVIYIDAEDALRNAAFYVSEALRGIDHSRMARH